MKKFNLFIFLLLIHILAFSQKDTIRNKIVIQKLRSLKDIIHIDRFSTNDWNLYNSKFENDYEPTKAVFVINNINKYLLGDTIDLKKRGNILEYRLIKKYKNNIDSLFQELNYIGNDQVGKFFNNFSNGLPISFCLYGDTALSFFVTSTYIGNTYNTLKLTSRQRAAKVITSYIIPSLKSFTKNFNNKEIKFYGMSCIYGSKDFSSNSPLATVPEFVTFIASSKIIKKYVNGDITEEDLINIADIYLSDRDMNTDIKKIKITLE